MRALLARSWALGPLMGMCLLGPSSAFADFQFKQGSFAKTAAVAPAAQAVTGVGFQPKAVIFFYTRQPVEGPTPNINGGWGFTTGPSAERAIGIAAIDSQTPPFTADSGKAQSLTGSIVINTTNPEFILARAELVSFDADGFTLTWTTNEPRADIIQYIALGGSDLTNAVAASFQPAVGLGIEPVAVGFQPDFVMMLSARTGVAEGTGTEAQHSIGFASRTPFARVAAGVQLEDDDFIRDTWVWQRTDSVLAAINNTGPGDTRFDIAFTATGFDINKLANGLSGFEYVHYLALKGGRYGVGAFAKNNTLATPPDRDQSVAGVGFRPVGLILSSDNFAANAAVQPQGRISFGASDLASNGATWWHDRDGIDPTDSNMRTSTSEIAVHADGVGGATVNAAGYLKSFDPNGFTVTWQINNTGPGANHEILYAAFGTTTNYRSIGTRVNYGTFSPEGAGTTVSTVLGSRLVTGAGTSWKTSNRGRGDRINIAGADYTVYQVLGDTQLELTSPFGGTTGGGKSYTIVRQFATLAAWEDCVDGPPGVACPFFPVTSASLVTDNRSEVGVVYKETALAGVTIDGSLTDADHSITLTADDRNRHYGIAGGGAVVNNGTNTNPAIQVLDDHVTVEWLEIKGGSGVTGHGLRVSGIAVSNRLGLRNNLVHSVSGDGIEIADPSVILDLYNNIIYNGTRRGIHINTPQLDAGSQLRMLNNTVYNHALAGIFAPGGGTGYGTLTLVNNISHSSGAGDFAIAGAPATINAASSDNLSSDPSASAHCPSGGEVPSAGPADALFKTITPGGEDLHLEPTGAAVNQGADLSGLFTDDVDGRPRVPLWDIGADDTSASATADLGVTKTDGQTSEVPGTGVSYTITVTNNGPDTVTSLTVSDPVPPTILGPVFTPSVGSYNPANGRWTGLTLATGQSATLTLSGTISSSATGTLLNVVTVAPPGGVVDPASGNNSAPDSDALNPQADLEVLKTGPASARLGETIVYSLTARNNGPSDASGVTLVDTLPPQVAFLSSVPAGPTCTYDTVLHRVSCSVGALASGATFPVTMTVRIVSEGVLTNAASVGGFPDPLPGNNTAFAVTTMSESSCAGGTSWWNPGWGRRRKITLNNLGQAESLVGFPLMIRLDSTRVDYSRTQNSGQDIRFVDADDTTVLPHEIERWNEAGSSYVWVRVPQIDASSNTDYIWMYYDNPFAPDGQNPPAVWDAGFKMVQHLEEASGPHLDSTANDNDSVVLDVMLQGSAAGQVNGADLFSAASTDHIDVANSPSLDVGATESLTVEAWIRTTVSGTWQIVVSKEDTLLGGEYQLFTNFGTPSFWLGDSGGNTARADGFLVVSDGAWHYLVGRWNETMSTAEIFMDGLNLASATNAALGATASSSTPLVIGEEGDLNRGGNFDGTIDEVRISKTYRSNDWIRAQNLSMRDVFAGYGPEAGACNLRSIGTRPNYGTAEPEGAGTTVSANPGSRVVTGAGTAWKSANRGRGDAINIEGLDYTVLSVDSETQLTLTSPFAGAPGTGKSYRTARKFATLTDWERCIDGVAPPPVAPCEGVSSDSLVADNRGEVGIAYRDSVFAGDLRIDGRPDNLNTGAGHTITLTADPGNRHHGLPGAGVVIDNAAGTTNALRVSDNFVKVEWLEIRNGPTFDGITIDDFIDAANRIVVANNLVHDVGGDGIELRDSDLIADVYNNIVYNNARPGISVSSLAYSGGSRIRLFNNTLYNNGIGGIWADVAGSFPNVLLQNNLAHSNAAPGDFRVPAFDPASSNNLGGDGSGITHSTSGGVDSTLANVRFANAAAGNLHILSGSTAESAGTPLTPIFDYDIDNTLRQTPWDIGADDGAAMAFTDLAITKSHVPLVPGAVATYTITVRNNGPSPVTSLLMNDTLPPQLQSPSWGLATQGTYNPGTGVWDFLTDSLDSTEAASVTVSGTIGPAERGVVVNTATVAPSGGVTDLVSGNDTCVDSDNLMPEAQLELTKTDGPDPVGLGGTTTYTLTVRNFGPSDATTVTLIDDLPVEVAFVSATPPCVYDGAFHRVTCDLMTMAPAGVAMVTIQVRAVAGGVVRNVATVTAVEFDPVPGNNTDDEFTTITVGGDGIRFFTVTSVDGKNTLEWVNPATWDTVRIRYDSGPTTCSLPKDQTEGAVLVNSQTGPAGPGEKDYFEHLSVTNTWKYCYTIFVQTDPSPDVSYGPARSTSGRPFSTAGAVKFAFSVGATSMAPPGVGVDAVHAVANDNALHAMVKAGLANEGTWPPGWKPRDMNGPSQGRPSTIAVPVAGPPRVVFLGSQDRHVYAISADTGAIAWMSADLGDVVLAGPSGMFRAFPGGDRDHIFVGTRRSPQGEFHALKASDGTTVGGGWPFSDGGAPHGKVGPIFSQATVVYPPSPRVFFTSFAMGGPPDDKTVWCLDITNPTAPSVLWSAALPNVTTSPAVRNGRVYVGTSTGEVHALDAANGMPVWAGPITTGDGPVKGLMLDRLSPTGDLYFATTGKVWKYEDNVSFFTPRWSRTLTGPSAPVILAGTNRIYVGAGDGSLHGLKSADGADESPAFPIPLGDGTAGVGSVTIDVRNGYLYVGTEAGVVYAVLIP